MTLLAIPGLRTRKTLLPFNLTTGTSSNMTSVPLLLPIAAVTNIVLFLVLGVIIPWFLTGGLENPIVQSKTWDGTTLLGPGRGLTPYAASDLYRKCWHNMIELPDACKNQEGILIDRLVLQVEKAPCPFAHGACQPDTPAIQFEHINTTFREYGLNMNSRILHSHRLTCAPLQVATFILDDIEGLSWLDLGRRENMNLKKNQTEIEDGLDDSEWSYGPRYRLSFPDNRAHHGKDALASYWQNHVPPSLIALDPFDQGPLHEHLFRKDGWVFPVVFNAGRSRYSTPIEDPIFSAHLHDQSEDSITSYWPDQEYTAIGCLEQHRLCIFGGICSDYSDMAQAMAEIGYKIWGEAAKGSDLDNQSVAALHALEELYYEGTVQILVSSLGTSALLSTESARWTEYYEIDPLRQWEMEIQFWFESAFLSFRLTAHGMVISGRDSFWQADEAQEVICNHTLFVSSDYTNVNFVGLVTVIVAIVLVSVASHAGQLTQRGRQGMKVVHDFVTYGKDLLSLGISLIQNLITSQKRR